MANFKPSILKSILQIEGGYVNDPDDNGGETWQGVARNSSPRWAGWAIIDAYKKANPKTTAEATAGRAQGLNKILYADAQLAELVAVLYENQYFKVNRLGEIKDQALAANACDCGVNCGTFTGAKMLQRAYNLASPGNVIDVDGNIGNGTIAAVNAADGRAIYGHYNELRRAYYENIIARKPSQAKYRASWLSRIKPYYT